MLTRNLQKVLDVRKRAVFIRFYFTGNNVHSNLESRVSVFRNPRSSLGKNLILEWRRQECAVGFVKIGKTISRLCHTQINREPKITENAYAHSILERRGIKNLAFPLEVNTNVTDEEVESILNNEWQDSSPEDMLHAFETLSYHAKLNFLKLDNEKYAPILEALRHKVADLDDDKFRRVFQYLQLWYVKDWGVDCIPYVNLCAELDRECLKRFKTWTVDEVLLVCDYFSALHLAKSTKYPMTALKMLGNKPKRMSTDALVTFMYLMNTCRKPPVNMYEIEYRLQGMLDQFTADEMGLIAMGFFKTQSPIRDPHFIHQILLKVLQEIETVGDISLSAIMKIMRYSKTLKEAYVLQHVLTALQSRVPNLSIACLTNVIHTAATFQIFIPKTVDIIIEKMNREIDTARLKDLERLTWALLIFDYNPKSELFRNLTENLSHSGRKIEFSKFPKSSATMLSHLSHIGIFPFDVIKMHFDPCFRQQAFENNPYKIGYNYFTLETNLKIDAPEYDGPFLEPSIRDFLAKKFLPYRSESADKISAADKVLLEVTHMCKLILERDTAVCIDQVLPHYVKGDIIIAFDENDKPVDVQPLLSSIPTGTIKYSSQMANNLKWFAVVIATQNQMITGTNNYVGPLMSKIRQLDKIGYTPIVIRHNIWHGLNETVRKQKYLKEQLFEAMDHGATVAL